MHEDMPRRGEVGRRIGVNLGPRVVDIERRDDETCDQQERQAMDKVLGSGLIFGRRARGSPSGATGVVSR